jgi:acyl-coenzyme A synthetase/AMP-(fatty) acid ligase
MNSLATWLASSANAPGCAVCRRGDALTTRADFLARVTAVVDALDSEERGRWLVHVDGAEDCAVALLALWQHGSIAVLPPNQELGTLRDLAPTVRGIVSDREASALAIPHVSTAAHENVARGRNPGRRWRALDPQACVLELCTSGTSGERKRVMKRLAQIEAEIATLERTFGAVLDSGLGVDSSALRVLGTVSHQHIFGLLFRVLWPLCSGRVFLDAAPADPSSVKAELARAERAIVVSSPALLERLPELVDLRCVRGRCCAVFSSGGPLDARAARRWAEELGVAPIEVLGSTETGGIAWRRQSGADASAAWTPFDNVVVGAREDALEVRSPMADGGGSASAPVPTGDRVELLGDGCFLLLGRADRIVKLHDERVSLDEIEARLRAHAFVGSAAALMLPRNGAARIGVAVVLAREGEHALRHDGRRACIATLRAHLASHLRSTALPRAWRFVSALPSDAQGKTSRDALVSLFARFAAQDAVPWGALAHEPECAAPRSTACTSARLVRRALENERELEVVLEVPEDLWCLQGHFEGFPVVPGVVQIQWVIDWARSWTQDAPALRAIEALKFKQFLIGGARFHLRLERASDVHKLRFRLWNERGELSSGRLLFAAEGA